MKLRDYQTTLIQKARAKLREIRERLAREGIKRGPRLLIQCPTGGGKTAISAFIAQSAIEKGGTVGFNCHRDFLVDQTSKTWGRLNIDHSFIAAGRWYNQWTAAHVGMVQSIRSRLAKVKAPSLCLWDEAHHIGAASWAGIMGEWPDATHIGFTATPIRLDGKGLDTWFDDIVCGPSVRWLIDNGHLSDYVAYAPSSPDLTGMHTRMGDFVKDEVDAAMDKAVIIGDMVRDYRQYANGLRAVYFCTSISHSQHVADTFNASGIPARHLDGDHSTTERSHAAGLFADGELQVLTNVDLFGEGYDLAAQAGRDVTIDCVGMARPTKSVGLFLQQVGRALRPKPDGGRAVILDHAGNIMAQGHGLPDDDREWSLSGVERKASELVQCSGCGASVPAQTIACRYCGEKLRDAKERAPSMGGRVVEQKDGDLQEIDKAAMRKANKLEEWQCSSIAELIDLARRREYKDPERWAGYMWTARKKRDDAKEYARKQQMDFYEKLAIEGMLR